MAFTRVSDTGNLIYPGIAAIFNRAMKMARVLQYKPFVMEKNIKAKHGYYDTMGNLSAAEEHTEGNQITYDKISHLHRTTITAKVFVKGVQGSMESLHFDLYDEIKKNFGAPLVDTLAFKKEKVVADQYNNGFTTTGADGVYLFDDDHPLQRSPLENDNLATGALTPPNLTAGKIKFEFIRNQAGELYPTRPTHLGIHPAKMYAALEILNSNLIALELSNTKNVLQDYMTIKVATNSYFSYNTSTNVSPWFLLDKTLEAGCVLQTSKGVELNTRWDWDNLSYKGVAYEIYNAGIIAPGYGIVASTGA
jgi:phage major head subunit gpT-like protein